MIPRELALAGDSPFNGRVESATAFGLESPLALIPMSVEMSVEILVLPASSAILLALE